MWPLKSIVLEKWALFWGFQHTCTWGFQEDRWENVHFQVNLGNLSSKPRHVDLNSIFLENEPVLSVSTHIYGVSKEKDGKPFIFRVNLGMLTPQINLLGKTSPVLRVSTPHLWGFQGYRWVNVHFYSKTRNVTPQFNWLWKRALFWVFQHTCMVSKEIDGKMFIFQVNLGMWPSNRSSGKIQPCSEGFTHTYGFPRR